MLMASTPLLRSAVGNVTPLHVRNAQPAALHRKVRAGSQGLLFGVVTKQLSCSLLEKKCSESHFDDSQREEITFFANLHVKNKKNKCKSCARERTLYLMLECYRPVGGLVFTDTGVSQRIPLPFALNTGCVVLPLFYFFSFIFFLFCFVPFCLD